MPRTASFPPSAGSAAPPQPLRRLTLELVGVIALKIALLLLVWWLLFASQPKPDTSPAAMSQRFAPPPAAAQGACP